MVWDAERGRWVALIAERDRVSFYASPDLKTWSRVWEYVNAASAPSSARTSSDPGRRRLLTWVFGVSANGYATNEPATFAYWTGSFDGTSFAFDQVAPQWLDHGFDWYGAVTFEDPAAPWTARYAVGWMNNWDYAHTTPDLEIRRVQRHRLHHRESGSSATGRHYRCLQPVAALDEHATRARGPRRRPPSTGPQPLAYKGDAYQ